MNLTTEELFEEAFVMAKEKDRLLVEAIKNGSTHLLPPLHGIPFSIKDLIEVKGARSTAGCEFMANFKA